MATTDSNLQVINSMTEEMLTSLKDSNGKIPSLANQLIMTDDEDVNLSQLRTKVLWTNPNPTSDFTSQTITLNSSNYDYLMILTLGNKATTYFAPTVIIPKGKGGRLVFADTSENSSYKIMINVRDVTRVSDTQYTISACRYSHDTTFESGRNDLVIPYQIIGVLTTPAMIYTGNELFEGTGIGIKDGVISSNIPYFATSFDFTSVQSVTGSSSKTAVKTLKTYTANLPKGKYVSVINGVIKTTQFTVDLYPQIDGVYTGQACTNLTAYAGCSGIGIFNLTDGDHTINILLSSRGTGSVASYTKITFLLIRVGD